jgi:hypothetical protein
MKGTAVDRAESGTGTAMGNPSTRANRGALFPEARTEFFAKEDLCANGKRPAIFAAA